MNRVTFFVILLPIVIFAQVDTLDCLSYFPLHIGDKWKYEKITIKNSEWDTSYQNVSVIGDTFMSNNYTYFKLGATGPYYRIDTTSLSVNTWHDSKDTLLFDLSPFDGDIDSTILPDSSILYRKKVEGNAGNIVGQFEKIGYYRISDISAVGYEELTKGIGYTKYVIEEAMPYLKQLIGAEIDGVIYGNISGIESKNNLPNNYELYPNYPNPFNANTKIRYEMKNPGYVTIQIFDITGNSIEIIEESRQETGQYLINWNASNYSTGIYIIQMKVGEFIQSRKCLLLK